jgi:hypothetical protein
MKHIEQILSLMTQLESILEFIDALKESDIPAWYMIYISIAAGAGIKQELGLKTASGAIRLPC